MSEEERRQLIVQVRGLLSLASVCLACHGDGIVAVWDSERREDWHQETCRACKGGGLPEDASHA